MKQIKQIALLVASFLITPLIFATDGHVTYKLHQTADADWLIVGAGPAGIATLGVLLDIGISQDRMSWIDPEFNVGRMGAFYGNVPGTSKAREFVDFINACNAFKECSGPEFDYLKTLDPNYRGYELQAIVKPLQTVTNHLRTKVNSIQDYLASLNFNNDVWIVGTRAGQSISANHVILATGSHPKTLNFEKNKILPLDMALDPNNLANLITSRDIVGVVGSSHSAILLLKFLSEMKVRHIYNFYKNPLQYAIDMGDWSLHGFTGLKGITADWAKNVLEKNPPANLTRIQSSDDATLQKMLRRCTKVIYAIGFERNELPAINGTAAITSYNETNGFIAPRLFGIGIAFPELTTNKAGEQGNCISLDCFMEYAQRLIPQWATDQILRQKSLHARAQLASFKEISSLFTIYSL